MSGRRLEGGWPAFELEEGRRGAAEGKANFMHNDAEDVRWNAGDAWQPNPSCLQNRAERSMLVES